MEFLFTNFKALSSYLLDANQRIFWGYLVSSLSLAALVYYWQIKRGLKSPLTSDYLPKHDELAEAKQEKSLLNFGYFLRYLFPRKVYFSQSARNDYWLFILNKLLKAALFPAVIITMVPVALTVSDGFEALFGHFEPLQLSSALVMAIFTIALFIFDDFTRFLLHYILHKVPVLWEFHKVHHSAQVLTPMTIYRSHPVESYLYACRMALTQGFVVGASYYFLGPTLKMIDIVGANLFVFAFNILGSNLRHSHIWLTWGDKLENWLISPAQHQVHHSDNPKHFDVNLGTALAIWDRMFSCHIKASQVDKLTIGIGEQYAQHSTLVGIYAQPFKQAYLVLVLGVKNLLSRGK